MSTPKYLSLITDEAEMLVGVDTFGNRTTAGYWKQIALAAEAINGAASSAADFLTGWMKRAAVAIDDYTNFGGAGNYNLNEAGYLAWIVDALENFLSITTTGSLEARFYELLGLLTLGDLWILMTGLWNDSGVWDDFAVWID